MAIIDFNTYVGFDKVWADGSGYMAVLWPNGSGGYNTSMYWSASQISGWTDASGYVRGFDAARGAYGDDKYKSVFVSTDRTRIGVFNHLTGMLNSITFAGTGLNNMARPSYAAGKILFFAANSLGRQDIYVINEDGTSLWVLSSGLNGVWPGSISPDGTWCVFAADTASQGRQLYRRSTEYGSPSQITPPVKQVPYGVDANYPEADQPAISPDGSQIAFVGGVLSSIGRWTPSTWVRFGLFRIPSWGGDKTAITLAQPGAGNKIDNPGWWPAVAGSGIVYDYYEPGDVNTGYWCTDGAGNYEWFAHLLPHGWSANPCFQAAS